jgi:phosphoglycerate dehydrogenase-like enzyme
MRILVSTDLEPADRIRIEAAFPEVTFVDGIGKEAAVESVPGCEVMFGSVISKELLAAADALQWIHTRSAGVNSLPFEELAGRGVRVTNSSGAHGIPIAENTLAMMLAFAAGLHLLIPLKSRREWNPESVRNRKFELEGQTLLVIGLGDIGTTLASKARAMGMKALGIRRRDLPSPSVDEVIPMERLLEALPRADHVALCLPLTPWTSGFFREQHFKAMKSTAYLYNAGRGKSVDSLALERALMEGWIAGAGLDTTDPEPIPPEDPLWSFPNVILTQHTSGSSPENSRRVTDIFIDNLRRYLSREPLENQVDLEARY